MFDIVIIGSGGAGLTAALTAKKLGAKVLVIGKTYPTHSQTSQAQGGINAVLNQNDTIKNFVEDTYKSSHNLANIQTIQMMCEKSKEIINWLDSIGVSFTRDDECNIAQRKLGGASFQRASFCSDYTGIKIIHTLYDNCIKESIDFLHENMLLNLIVEKQTVIGVTVLDIQNVEVKNIYAKTVIIASGGYLSLYSGFNTNSNSTTGDGIAAAFRAGAKLSNMELIQFHPTAIKSHNILISESARGEGGYLLNQKGNRFIDELKPRDEVSRAIFERLQNNEEVFLDMRHLDLEHINEALPQEKQIAYIYANKKIETELLSINPAAHYCMGGILVDSFAKTSLKNLFACGECAQANIHGANRLGGNSLLEVITFGKIAANSACKQLKNISFSLNQSNKQFEKDKKKVEEIFNLPNKINFYSKKRELGELFFKTVGLLRNEKEMNVTLQKLKEFQNNLSLMGIEDKSKIYNTNLVEFYEFQNLVELGLVTVQSALERRESRGAHFRVDYPYEDNKFAKNSIIYKKDGKTIICFEEIE